MANVLFSRLDNTVTGLDRPAAGPGEFTVQLPYEFHLTKPITHVYGEKQKTNEYGELLYKDNVTLGEDGEEHFDEVTVDRKPTAWEDVTNTYNVVGEGGPQELTTTTQVPVAWEELQPVMVPNEITHYITFQETPALFSYDEIHAAKITSIRAANPDRNLVYYDEEFPLENFADELANHAANMGEGIMALHPGGSCRTVKLQLGKTTDKIKLYLEAAPGVVVTVGARASEPFTDFVDGIAQLPEPADAVYVLFTNTTERYRDVYAVGILA